MDLGPLPSPPQGSSVRRARGPARCSVLRTGPEALGPHPGDGTARPQSEGGSQD